MKMMKIHQLFKNYLTMHLIPPTAAFCGVGGGDQLGGGRFSLRGIKCIGRKHYFGISVLAIGLVFPFSTVCGQISNVSPTTRDWTNGSGNSVYNNVSNWTGTFSINDLFFGRSGYPASGTVNVTGYSGRTPYVTTGDWTFDFSGGSAAATLKSWVFGYGADSAPVVSFTGNTGTVLNFAIIGLGLNGSSNNRLGTTSDTVTFDSGVSYTARCVQLGNSGMTSGGNNVFEVNNRTITLSDATNMIIVNGYDTGTAIADNQFLITNGGVVSGSGSVTVGTGSSLVVTGNGSQLNQTVGSGTFAISGDVKVLAGGSINTRAISVASTGNFVLDNSQITMTGDATVSGLMEVLNGSTYSSTNLTIATGGTVQVGGSSTLTGSGALSSAGGLQITGNSTVEVEQFQGGGTVQVESGSTFRFNTLSAGTLDVQGRAIWGAGNERPKGTLTVVAGTTLVLDGGNYNLNLATDTTNGTLLLQGATLEGTGTVGRQPDGGNDGTTLELRQGAKINPGAVDGPGTLVFNNAMKFMDGQTEVTFTIFSSDAYDQILAKYFLMQGGTLEVKLELSLDLVADLVNGALTEGNVFQLISDLDGITPPNIQGDVGITFDFGVSAAQLAAYGLGWDTSNFVDTGTVSLITVPEPGTWALLGWGALFLGWLCRRRANARNG